MQEITCNIQPFVCNPSFHVITYSKEGPWLCKPFFTPLKLRGVHNRLSWKQQETDHHLSLHADQAVLLLLCCQDNAGPPLSV